MKYKAKYYFYVVFLNFFFGHVVRVLRYNEFLKMRVFIVVMYIVVPRARISQLEHCLNKHET